MVAWDSCPRTHYLTNHPSVAQIQTQRPIQRQRQDSLTHAASIWPTILPGMGASQWNHDRLTDSVTKWLEEKLAHLKRSDHCWSAAGLLSTRPACLYSTLLVKREIWEACGWALGWLAGRSVKIGKGQQTGSNSLSPPQPQIRLFLPHCPCHQLWRIRFKRQAILLSIEEGKCSKKASSDPCF